MFRALGNSLLSLIAPQECHVCSRIVNDSAYGIACDACWSATQLFDNSSRLCAKCGSYSGQHARPRETRCDKCVEHHYDKAAAAGVYGKALAATVLHLKTVPHLAPAARTALRTAFDRAGFSPSLIIPVPLSRRRRLERGYNQADVIGRIVSQFSGVPVDDLSLKRQLHSPAHRVGMDMKARELTVKNSFEVTRPELVARQNVLLVDDVFTSGSTTSNCARVLKEAGAARVDVLTLARAVSD